LRFYRGGEQVSAMDARSTQRHEVKIELPLWWRLSLAPDWILQYATIAANQSYLYNSFAVKVSFPVVVRWGRGRLFQ
jgi:hypothetical protein